MLYNLRSSHARVLHQVDGVVAVVDRGQSQLHIALGFDLWEAGRRFQTLELVVHSVGAGLREVEVRRLPLLSKQLLGFYFVQVRHSLHVDRHVILQKAALPALCFYRI